MSNELKPCPFCGGESYIRNSAGGWYVRCKSKKRDFRPSMFTSDVYYPACFLAHTKSYGYDTKEQAIDAWNQRAERNCKPDNSGRCSCGTLVRWKDNCEPYETCDGLIAYKSIHPPVTRYYDYCPHCGARVVE